MSTKTTKIELRKSATDNLLRWRFQQRNGKRIQRHPPHITYIATYLHTSSASFSNDNDNGEIILDENRKKTTTPTATAEQHATEYAAPSATSAPSHGQILHTQNPMSIPALPPLEAFVAIVTVQHKQHIHHHPPHHPTPTNTKHQQKLSTFTKTNANIEMGNILLGCTNS